ncbi:MAG TPA: helix-turn-helix domain-containing protein [Pseudonocardiaceae bacterium]|nr:helix-turn-helix domain-containing protein [Pseudonocardiaceae bacterium]
MSLHRSALRYRLQRIRDVSGHDLNDPDTVQLAFRHPRLDNGARHVPAALARGLPTGADGPRWQSARSRSLGLVVQTALTPT